MNATPAVPDPTGSELAILQVLWQRGPSTVREVWSGLGEKSGYTTVLKLMQIMLEKRLVTRDERETSHVYASAIPKEKTQRRAVSNFIDKVFEGSASELVLRALSDRPLGPKELKAIRALLAQKEKDSQ